MSKYKFTNHAGKRKQQRGFNQWDVGLVLEYGSRSRCRGGAFTHYMDKQARRRLAISGKKPKGNLNFYVLVSDRDEIITVAPRKRRLRR